MKMRKRRVHRPTNVVGQQFFLFKGKRRDLRKDVYGRNAGSHRLGLRGYSVAVSIDDCRVDLTPGTDVNGHRVVRVEGRANRGRRIAIPVKDGVEVDLDATERRAHAFLALRNIGPRRRLRKSQVLIASCDQRNEPQRIDYPRLAVVVPADHAGQSAQWYDMRTEAAKVLKA